MASIHKFKGGDSFHDRYTLEKLIGVGGFADVWKAIDNMTGATVALKIYTNLDEDGMKDLAHEYTGMQSLNHTNILRAEHFDNWGNIPYLVMKFCGGGSLDKKIGKFNNDEIYEALRQITLGLKYLHENGIIHQDIKPANILIDNSHSRVAYVLSDFGISSRSKTRLSHSVNLKQQGVSMTESYAPPEKFSSKREDRQPRREGDIFSLGISFFELITGNLPFDELSTGRQLQYEGADIDFSEITDPNLRYIVEQTLEPDPSARPSAEQILQLLDGGSVPPKSPTDATQHFDDPEDNNGGGTDFDFPAEKTIDTPAEKTRSKANKTVRVKKEKSGNGGGFPKWAIIVLIALVVGVGCYFLVSNITGKSSSVTFAADSLSNNGYTATIDTIMVKDIPLEMVRIPGGKFMLGDTSQDSIADACESPAVERTVREFYIGKYEVTQALWEAVMGSNPSTKINNSLPVNNVSVKECRDFITKLNALTGRTFRLPSEVEWEYAAKVIPNSDGTVSSVYKLYAGADTPDEYAYYADNSGGTIHPVGEKKPNPMGVYDMNGNVIEWCATVFTDYATGEPIAGDNEISLRGGYFDSPAASVRNTSRGSSINQKVPAFGLRLAL